MIPIDIIEDENGDILLVDGDIVWGDATEQHVRDIFLAQHGSIRTNPLTGVGADDDIEDDTLDDLYTRTSRQLTRDGMKVKGIAIVNGKIVIDAKY